MSQTIELEDLFIIGSDCKVYLIKEDVYRAAQIVEQGRDGTPAPDSAPYIPEKRRYNLIGQALTKVVSWNVEGIPDRPTGYQFDLRGLRITNKVPKEDKGDPGSSVPDWRGYNAFEQVPDNIYLIVWDHPNEPGNTSYTVRLIDRDTVINEENLVTDVTDLGVLIDLFLAPQAQVGALSERDRTFLGMHGACYIANLASFRS